MRSQKSSEVNIELRTVSAAPSLKCCWERMSLPCRIRQRKSEASKQYCVFEETHDVMMSKSS
jgi:hypothetical protein